VSGSPPSVVAEAAPFVIGTAGHIDHGKSALVRALTGIDPDRLQEEKRRGMTIDLGFAHLDLPDGRRAGIVDVPGHDRLIRTMLAGAGGMDLVLLVVAADEGVMPQTREHLNILRFLRPRGGIIVLTKIDLVDDAAWVALVEEEVRRLTAGTFLDGAPLIATSARTGGGLEALVAAIGRSLDALTARSADGAVRLPIDRVFTMAGFGTVVTGTLWSGRIRAGDALTVLPLGDTARVRQIERHGVRVEEVTAGSRAALNLAGVERESLARGSVLATAGTLRPSLLLDAQVRLLPEAPVVPHLSRLRFYLGTDEALCRIALLDRDRLAPGEEAPAQLRFEQPVVAARDDRFVLRRYSPLETLGGGEVVAVDPPRRRRGAAAAETVAALAAAPPERLLREAVAARGLAGATAESLAPLLAEPPAALVARLRPLVSAGDLLQAGERFYAREVMDEAREALLRLLDQTHREQPWRLGLPRDEIRGRALKGADDRLATTVLDHLTASGAIGVTRGFVHRSEHRPRYRPEEAVWREIIYRTIGEGRFAPPGLAEVEGQTSGRGEQGPGPGGKAFQVAVQSLREEGALLEVAPGILFATGALEEIRQTIVARIQERGAITVADLRDTVGTSRKYALALLEYFDGIRLTRRIGDRRVLAGRAAEASPSPSAPRPPR
jgi:selenocysteine-specific elongation factor